MKEKEEEKVILFYKLFDSIFFRCSFAFQTYNKLQENMRVWVPAISSSSAVFLFVVFNKCAVTNQIKRTQEIVKRLNIRTETQWHVKCVYIVIPFVFWQRLMISVMMMMAVLFATGHCTSFSSYIWFKYFHAFSTNLCWTLAYSCFRNKILCENEEKRAILLFLFVYSATFFAWVNYQQNLCFASFYFYFVSSFVR